MPNNRFSEPPYTEDQVNYWLRFLARGMEERGLTIFQIEQIQPSWLQKRSEIWLYALASRMFESVIFLALIICPALVLQLILGSRFMEVPPPPSPMYAFLAILAVGSFLGIGVGIVDFLGLRTYSRHRHRLRTSIRLAFVWLSFISMLAISGPPEAEALPAVTVFVALFFFAYSRGEGLNGDIRSVESLIWSWRRAVGRGGRQSLIFALICAAYWVVVIDHSNNIIAKLIRGLLYFIFLPLRCGQLSVSLMDYSLVSLTSP